MESGEGGGTGWNGGEGWGEKAENCTWTTIKIKEKKDSLSSFWIQNQKIGVTCIYVNKQQSIRVIF